MNDNSLFLLVGLKLERFFCNNWLIILMLDKYEDFFKISKSQECSLYTAIARQGKLKVLLKRFKSPKLTWDQVLRSKSLQYSQKTKSFLKMVEIFKNKGQYYIVYERPSGPSLAQSDTIGPFLTDNFYPLACDLIAAAEQLRSVHPNAWLIPQWIFVHRGSVRIAHFQPFFGGKEGATSDHVFLYQNQHQGASTLQGQEGSIIPLEKKRDIILNLGLSCYYLLTGSRCPEITCEQEFYSFLAELERDAEKRIFRLTKDKSLSQMVRKMLSSNVFDAPNLSAIREQLNAKNAALSPKRKHQASIEIQLQKIRLDTQIQPQPQFPRKLRPCCAEKEASIEKLNEERGRERQLRDIQRKGQPNLRQSAVQLNYSNYSKPKKQLVLPNIHRHSHRRTVTEALNTSQSRPLMFSNRSTTLHH